MLRANLAPTPRTQPSVAVSSAGRFSPGNCMAPRLVVPALRTARHVVAIQICKPRPEKRRMLLIAFRNAEASQGRRNVGDIRLPPTSVPQAHHNAPRLVPDAPQLISLPRGRQFAQGTRSRFWHNDCSSTSNAPRFKSHRVRGETARQGPWRTNLWIQRVRQQRVTT
jgi:hypothetical protein